MFSHLTIFCVVFSSCKICSKHIKAAQKFTFAASYKEEAKKIYILAGFFSSHSFDAKVEAKLHYGGRLLARLKVDD